MFACDAIRWNAARLYELRLVEALVASVDGIELVPVAHAAGASVVGGTTVSAPVRGQ